MKARTPDAVGELRSFVRLLPEEAIEQLTYIHGGESPAMALLSAVAFKEDVTPRLLEELALSPAQVEACYRAAPDGGTCYFLHTMAMYLLGLFEEPRAWPLILEHFATDPALANELAGDTVTEQLPAILARCYDGTGVTPLMAIIENGSIDAFLRNAYLKAYHGIVLQGRADRPVFFAFVRRLLDNTEKSSDQMWVQLLTAAAAGLKEPALRGTIYSLFDRGVIEAEAPFFILHVAKEDIEEIYRESDEKTAEDILQTGTFDDLIGHICGWSWFQEPERTPVELVDAAARARLALWGPWTSEPFVREDPKTGRNDPCPCGSGKKYKKCCLDGAEPPSALFDA